MIIIQIMGGLGNQMSQYAFLQLMREKYKETEIKVDLRHYIMNSEHEGYILEESFPQISLNEASYWELFRILKQFPIPYFIKNSRNGVGKAFLSLLRRINFIFKKMVGASQNVLCQTIESGYEEEKKFFQLDISKDWYLSGYWHSYDYSSVMSILRYQFLQPSFINKKNFQCESMIHNKNSVSIHIRRGDYVNSMYDVVGINYYRSAIKIIENKVSNPHYFIFSDDVEYVEENFEFLLKDSRTIVNWNKGEYSCYDIYLMSLCRHNIIANSTFSYWAALLNANPDKIVIRPSMQTRERKTWEVDDWILLD